MTVSPLGSPPNRTGRAPPDLDDSIAVRSLVSSIRASVVTDVASVEVNSSVLGQQPGRDGTGPVQPDERVDTAARDRRRAPQQGGEDHARRHPRGRWPGDAGSATTDLHAPTTEHPDVAVEQTVCGGCDRRPRPGSAPSRPDRTWVGAATPSTRSCRSGWVGCGMGRILETARGHRPRRDRGYLVLVSSLPYQLSARVQAVAGIDPELRPSTKPQFGHFQSQRRAPAGQVRGSPAAGGGAPNRRPRWTSTTCASRWRSPAPASSTSGCAPTVLAASVTDQLADPAVGVQATEHPRRW